jgi:AcrR family transcriptional regulator
MRDIARAAGMSLGAAYYYFPSKEAIVFAFYDGNQADAEAIAERTTGDARAQLGALFHGKLRSVRDHRRLLGSIVQRLVDPGDPVSAFSAHTRAIRDRAIAVFERPLRGVGLPAESIRLVARSLWLLQLAALLIYVNDTSRGQRRTHGLVDDALDLLVPMLPLLATPPGRAMTERAIAALSRAHIEV